MTEARAAYPLKLDDNCAMLNGEPPEMIQVSRADLEHEHLHLLARLHQLRRLLGYPPLLTGKHLRQAHNE